MGYLQVNVKYTQFAENSVISIGCAVYLLFGTPNCIRIYCIKIILYYDVFGLYSIILH